MITTIKETPPGRPEIKLTAQSLLNWLRTDKLVREWKEGLIIKYLLVKLKNPTNPHNKTTPKYPLTPNL